MSTRRLSSLLTTIALFLAFFLTLTPQVAQADTMSHMVIEVALQPDGSGIITETRQMTLTSGTEIYIPMNDIDGSEVSHFSVQEEGVNFTDVGAWDVNRSQAEKAGTYGINNTNDGIELCWGIGDYGQHTYLVTYTITNMVRQLTDGQSMYWKLFNEGTNLPPEELELRVTAPTPLSLDNAKIWGFGFPGDLQIQDGMVTGSATAPLSSNHRVILLVQFLENPFQAVQSLNMSLADQETQAKEGSSYGPSDGRSSGEGGFFSNILSWLAASIFPIVILLSIFGRSLRKKGRSANQTFGGVSSREINARNKDKYYRDVPYTEGPLTDVAHFLQKLNVGNTQEYFNAYLLKWMKEGHIDHTTEEKGMLFKRQASVMQLNRAAVNANDLEGQLWNMMQAAAGADNRLDEREFTQWARKNHQQIENWETDLRLDSLVRLKEKGYLTEIEKKVLGLFTTTSEIATASGDQLIDHLTQFRNYLKDFSLLSEREAVQVTLWDQLLIWASLYGIAEEVAKEFEHLYPQYFQESEFTFTDLYIMSAFSNSFMSGYHSGVSDAQASSGGGGFTSIGGGGGSFGGGFGGGSR